MANNIFILGMFLGKNAYHKLQIEVLILSGDRKRNIA
jgi:hypothetical protein